MSQLMVKVLVLLLLLLALGFAEEVFPATVETPQTEATR